MKIHQIQSQETNGITEFSAKIDNFLLWYRFPSEYGLPGRADAFLAACLLPAMKIGENIEVDPAYPVSPKLLRGIYQLQQIYKCWYPELKHVEVKASVQAAAYTTSGVASFFSGGIDGSYTFLSHEQEISHLVFVKGIDIQVDNHRFV